MRHAFLAISFSFFAILPFGTPAAAQAPLHQVDVYPGLGLVKEMRWSPDGRFIVLRLAATNSVKLVDVAHHTIKSLYAHAHALTTVRFSPSGRYIVSGSQDGEVKIYDLTTRTVQSVAQHVGRIAAAEVSPNDRSVLSLGAFRGSIADLQLTDLATQSHQTLRSFAESGDGGDPRDWQAATFSQDGKFIYYAIDQMRGIERYSIADGTSTTLMQFCQFDGCWILRGAWAVSPDNRYLAASPSADPMISLVDLNTGSVRQTRWRDFPDGPQVMRFTADSKTLIASFACEAHGGDTVVGISVDDTTQQTPLLISNLSGVPFETAYEFNFTDTLDVSADGHYVAAISYDEIANSPYPTQIYDLQARKLYSLPSPDGNLESIRLAPDGSRLAEASKAGTLLLFDSRD